MRKLVALVAGLIFGLGLVVSDMINPARVLGFLDLFGGAWDPTLAFVMIGAVLVMAIAWLLAGARRQPVFGGDRLSAQVFLDRNRIVGAAFHGCVVSDNHAFLAADTADSGDQPTGRDIVIGVHLETRKLADFEERRT